jgi:hypothetical protein
MTGATSMRPCEKRAFPGIQTEATLPPTFLQVASLPT